MNLETALEILGIPWPRNNKIPCPVGHQADDGRSTPALHLYEDTNSFYCFSCGATGDAYGLISITTGTPIEEVLRQYGDGYEGKHSRPKVSKRQMFEAAIASHQEFLADFWPRLFRAASDAGVSRDEAAMNATWLADQVWDGPLTDRNIPEGRTPAQLRQEIEEIEGTMEAAIDWLKETDRGLPRTTIQPEVQHSGRHSRGSVRTSETVGNGDQVRVGPSQGDDEEHDHTDQTPARLLHRRRLSRRGGGVRKR